MRAATSPFMKVWDCLRDRRGVALIEFAFGAALFVISLMGIIEFSRVLWIRNTLQHAADEAGHYAMIHAGATQDQLISYTKQAAAPLDTSAITVTVSWDTAGSTTFVTILVNYQVGIMVPFLPENSIPVAGRARVPQIS